MNLLTQISVLSAYINLLETVFHDLIASYCLVIYQLRAKSDQPARKLWKKGCVLFFS